MGTEVAIASLVLSVVSQQVAASQQRKAGKIQRATQKEAQEQQSAVEKARDAASRRQQLRQERIRRAQVIQQAENVGGGDSSGVVGTTSAIQSQVGANLAFMTGQQVGADAISGTLQRGADATLKAQNKALVAGQVSNISGSFFNAWAGSKAGQTAINKLFS